MKNAVGESNKIEQKDLYDDFAVSRVPRSERKNWVGISVMRFGQISALSQFLLGATLGFGMDFWDAFWAITLGSVILEIVSIFVGIAGQREGMSTTLLVRWTGFGKIGAVILSIIISISMIGWFGIQNEVFASGLSQILGGPTWAWSIFTGMLVTLVVVFGIASLGITAYITVPLFLIVVFYSIASVLNKFSLEELIHLPFAGEPISIAVGASMVAGGFIAGAIITPDMSRFNRSKADVIKQTVVGITLGEYIVGLIGVLLAHAVKSDDVISIIMGTSGILGTIVLITATLKINDWNLYASSLGIVNLIDLGWGKKVSRTFITIIVGILGTILSVMGVLSSFQDFLVLLGVALPPVGGIITIEYFVIKRYEHELARSREKEELPSTYELWNPITLISWIISIVVGLSVHWGIPSINSLIVAAVAYWILNLFTNKKKYRTVSTQA